MATRKSTKFSTDVHIKNLKPRSKTYELADAIYRGLRIRVSPKGLRTWFYRYRDPTTGNLSKATLGTYPQMSLAMAREACADLRVLRDSGERPQQVIQAERRKRIEAAERATDPAPKFDGVLIRQKTVRRVYLDNMPANSFYLLVNRDTGFPKPVSLLSRTTFYSKAEIESYFNTRGRRKFSESVCRACEPSAAGDDL
jgi:hypothetical protein